MIRQPAIKLLGYRIIFYASNGKAVKEAAFVGASLRRIITYAAAASEIVSGAHTCPKIGINALIAIVAEHEIAGWQSGKARGIILEHITSGDLVVRR
mgnify:CR=1 FL=1